MQSKIDCVRPALRTRVFVIMKVQHKMDAMPTFGVSEVPSNPQLTLNNNAELCKER